MSSFAAHSLWVVIPAYNEERFVGTTLSRLGEQSDAAFTVVVVDNGSTDATAALAREWDGKLNLHVIDEPQKGTGSAADTGFRYAISHGARLIARTDADCLPSKDWTAAIRRAFGDGLQMVSGPLRARTDEFTSRWWERSLLPTVVTAAAMFGRFRPANRDPAYVGPYVMMPGCNVAITAELYVLSGGFPRTRIEQVHEDRALVNRVRRHTRAYGLRKDMVVYGSIRRLRAYGLLGTLAWYADHRYSPTIVDIR